MRIKTCKKKDDHKHYSRDTVSFEEQHTSVNMASKVDLSLGKLTLNINARLPS